MNPNSQADVGSYSSLIDRLVAAAPDSRLDPSKDPNDVWIYVDPEGSPVPAKGWKLHVSAIPSSAEDVLRRSFPVLARERVAFKIAADERHLYELNQGIGGRRQVGKFITIYPRDDAQAVRIATALDEATRDLRGPRVPSDRPLSPTSLVHYRFGDFVLDEGSGDGSSSNEAPADPFESAGVVTPSEQRLIAGRYLITSTLHRSVRGAIHLAVDVKNAATCVLKRAWRDACAMPDGRDARDRAREEAELMKSLGPDRDFPEIADVVEHEGDLFVVMEYVRGTTWARWVHDTFGDGRTIDPEKATRAGLAVAEALEKIHSHGYAHRDLSPANVILRDEGGIALIDFELARRPGRHDETFAAGTPGYMSPAQRRGDPAAVSDDAFGLAALLFLAATGTDPDPHASRDDITSALASTGLSESLGTAISAALTDEQPEGGMKPLVAALGGNPTGRESAGGI